MQKLIIASAMTLAFGTTAAAQGGPTQSTTAIKTAHTVNAGAAETGRNSFTEGQAREHIAHAGFASVSHLTKGNDGVWRGTARKSGHTVQVALDFKGNVSTSNR